jgi:hypothetical protein
VRGEDRERPTGQENLSQDGLFISLALPLGSDLLRQYNGIIVEFGPTAVRLICVARRGGQISVVHEGWFSSCVVHTHTCRSNHCTAWQISFLKGQ